MRAAPAPHEQLGAELVLELADLFRDVRLDRGEGVGRRGERALLRDRKQGIEMSQLHAPILPSLYQMVTIVMTRWTD